MWGVEALIDVILFVNLQVFEYVEKNLLEALEECGNGLDPELVRTYMYQLVKAIEWCHRHNVIHRGASPKQV